MSQELRVPMKHLDPVWLTDLFNHVAYATGDTSIQAVKEELEKLGVYNQYTGRPFTHQAISATLRRVAKVKHTRGTAVDPVVIYNPSYPMISTWLQSKLPNATILSYKLVTPEDCIDRDVYGAPPPACMLVARRIWWVYYKNKPVLRDVIPDERFRLESMVCQMGPKVRRQV